MPAGWLKRRLGWTAAVMAVVVVGCLLYIQRELIGVYWRVRDYCSVPAPQPELDRWFDLRPDMALPVLARALQSPEETACRKAGGYVVRWIGTVASEPSSEASYLALSVAEQLRDDQAKLSVPGWREAIRISYQLVSIHLGHWSPYIPTLRDTAGETLLLALGHPEPEVRLAALSGLAAVWKTSPPGGASIDLVREWKHEAYYAAARQLGSENPVMRAAAASALAGAPFHEKDQTLIQTLADPDPAVQFAALSALAKDRPTRLLPDQLPFVSDLFLSSQDKAVHEQAGLLLANAGVAPRNIAALRLAAHPLPARRAQAVTELAAVARDGVAAGEIEPILIELSRDADPIVRLAFAATLKEWPGAAVRRRLAEMAGADPDPRVRAASGNARSPLPAAGRKDAAPR
jgi:HEAT repeat protein